MKRVLVLANNLAQASFRLRVAALAPLLAQRGFQFDIRLRPKSWRELPAWWRLLRTAGDWHAVVVQRKLLDGFSAGMLHRYARKIFYDVDDAVMFHNRPVGRISRWRNHRRVNATFRVVDHVVAGNDYLADFARQHGRPATVAPTVVDFHRYEMKRHEATPTPRLVWIGSKSTLGYVNHFLPALEQAARLTPGLQLLIIADKTLSSDVLPIEYEPWAEQSESAALCRGDIGIAPTPVDDWTLGKCGFKILQYMAAGLPVIASPVGANAQIVQDGVTGLLPREPSDWPAAISQLAGDVTLRSQMGQAARAVAESQYSLERAAAQWAQLLDD